jgi:hypothetical protein
VVRTRGVDLTVARHLALPPALAAVNHHLNPPRAGCDRRWADPDDWHPLRRLVGRPAVLITSRSGQTGSGHVNRRRLPAQRRRPACGHRGAGITFWPQVLPPKRTFAAQLRNNLIQTANRRRRPNSVHGFILRPVQAQHQYEFAIGSGEPVGFLVSSRGLVLNVQVR